MPPHRKDLYAAVVRSLDKSFPAARDLRRGKALGIYGDPEPQSGAFSVPQLIQIYDALAVLPEQKGLRCPAGNRPGLHERVQKMFGGAHQNQDPGDGACGIGPEQGREQVKAGPAATGAPVKIHESHFSFNNHVPDGHRVKIHARFCCASHVFNNATGSVRDNN